ncbi:MAG: hypothetical protein ACPGVG_16880, partial [Mycobacterium sp.]
GEIVLIDSRGDYYPLEWVSVVQGGWGYDHEGVAKLPRPFKYDSSGNPVIRGDIVLIQFLNGNPRLPVIMGGVRRIDTQNTTLPARHDKDGADANRLALRLAPLDDAGEEAGEVLVELGADGVGSVAATVSDTVTAAVGSTVDVEVGDGTTLDVHIDESVMTVGRSDGTARPLVQAEEYLDDEADAIQDIFLMLAGLGLPPTKAALFTAKIQLYRATTALNGGTYFTDRLKAD